MRLAWFCFVWLVLHCAGVGAQDAPPPSNLADLASFSQTYYQRPQPQLIAGIIQNLHRMGLRDKPLAGPPFVAFLSEVFAANPGLVPQWRTLIAKQDPFSKRFLEQALALSEAGGVLQLKGHSPALNDLYWGAFFASGRPVFVEKLVEQLRYWDERDDLQLFTAGASAKWSLASNAESHPAVRSTLEAQVADPRTQALIAELLAQGPGRVMQETAEVVKRQRQSGKWR